MSLIVNHPFANSQNDYTRCLDRVAAFMTPILQGLKDMTGYTWVLLGGGPNPRAGGDMGTVQYIQSALSGVHPANIF